MPYVAKPKPCYMDQFEFYKVIDGRKVYRGNGRLYSWDAYTYEVGLITAFERIKKDGLPKVHCEIPEEDITDYIKGNGVNDEFIPIIEKGL